MGFSLFRIPRTHVVFLLVVLSTNVANCCATCRQGENAFLLREEAMVDDTRIALQSYSAALRQNGTSGEMGSLPQSQATGDEAVSTAAEQASDLQVSPTHEEFESKTETPSEPAMPAQTPPPPPDVKMLEPHAADDPFAEVLGKEDCEDGGLPSPTQPGVESPKFVMQQPSNEEKAQQRGFDAFPPLADAFDSDPFAMSGFSGNGSGEVTVDDPFSATDVVFSNATAAASDGFDAFPSSTDAQFDAFGQNSVL